MHVVVAESIESQTARASQQPPQVTHNNVQQAETAQVVTETLHASPINTRSYAAPQPEQSSQIAGNA